MSTMPEISSATDATRSSTVRGRATGPFDLLDVCHQQIGQAVMQLEALVDRLQDEGVDGHARTLARDIFQFFSTTARDHHKDEELHIFPALLNSGDAELVQHTRRLQQDHGWIEEDWLELAPQIEAIAAGYSWYNMDQLVHAIPMFAALYADHMALEESLIYPEAKARMAHWDLYGMGREMAERRRRNAST